MITKPIVEEITKKSFYMYTWIILSLIPYLEKSIVLSINLLEYYLFNYSFQEVVALVVRGSIFLSIYIVYKVYSWIVVMLL